jgi:hypothetical protein
VRVSIRITKKKYVFLVAKKKKKFDSLTLKRLGL